MLLLCVSFGGTIHEQMCVVQISVLSLLTLYFLLSRDSFSAQTSGTAFLFAMLSLLVMYLSPGTAVRMGSLLSQPFLSRLTQTLGVATVFGGITALKFFTKPMIYALLLFLPDIVSGVEPFDEKISKRIRAWHIFLLVALIAPFQQAIGGFAMGMGLPARADGLAIWLMAASWVFLWVFCYRDEYILNKIRSLHLYRYRGVALALCLVLSSNFISLAQDLRIAPLYLAENRMRENIIQKQKEEGKTDIIVPTLTVKPKLLFFSDIRPFPNDWKNQSFAQYWGVNSIRTLPSSLLNDERKQLELWPKDLSALEALAYAGDTETAFDIGEIYDTTFARVDCVQKDNELAAKWYHMAAEQGDAHAARRLTRLYSQGSGVPQSYLHAIWWLLRSQF
ncbi:hypothetical protein AGMMS50276_09210 [Synergistales bacterium]|nr:hypothetical protein AGMMS50276_09210 [Synergistales bacterium]